LFDTLRRDLSMAYASATNPNTFFVADGSTVGTLLLFTTFARRITPGAPQTGGPLDSSVPVPPQSDVAIVRYSHDPNTGEFSRPETGLPSFEALPDPSTVGTILSRRVRSVTFQFFDASSGNLRGEWNFTNQQAASQSGSSQSSGSSLAGSGANEDT